MAFANAWPSLFSLGIETIQRIGQSAAAQPKEERDRKIRHDCLSHASRRFDGLAEHIEPRTTWADIVLQEMQRRLLGVEPQRTEAPLPRAPLPPAALPSSAPTPGIFRRLWRRLTGGEPPL